MHDSWKCFDIWLHYIAFSWIPMLRIFRCTTSDISLTSRSDSWTVLLLFYTWPLPLDLFMLFLFFHKICGWLQLRNLQSKEKPRHKTFLFFFSVRSVWRTVNWVHYLLQKGASIFFTVFESPVGGLNSILNVTLFSLAKMSIESSSKYIIGHAFASKLFLSNLECQPNSKKIKKWEW